MPWAWRTWILLPRYPSSWETHHAETARVPHGLRPHGARRLPPSRPGSGRVVQGHRQCDPRPMGVLHHVGRPSGRREDSARDRGRSEEHTSELQSLAYLVCRLLLEKKKRYLCDTYV